jgi:dynein heavy chain
MKEVLKQDPEMALQGSAHPGPVLARSPSPSSRLISVRLGPLIELDFWKALARNLNSIFHQLQTDRVRRVLRFLDRAKSTYTAPFGKLCKEMFHKR